MHMMVTKLYSYWKINAAYALGGEEEVIQQVESLLDITVNYLIEIDYLHLEI